jgi:DnaJ-class molecular chaperone
MNPYLVLNVPADADDQTIRLAYLNALKASPPEADPQRFQAISQAYEKIKDQPSRHRLVLFNREMPADGVLDALVRYASHRRHFEPLPFDALQKLLTAVTQSGGKPS